MGIIENMRLDGKAIYVTGAASGIGKCAAMAFAEAGADVAIVDINLGYEFKVITCVVLGGVSVAGGSGRMSGVVAGTFIIGALNNGMVLMNINTWIQDIVLGIVLVLAVGFDCIQKKRQAN